MNFIKHALISFLALNYSAAHADVNSHFQSIKQDPNALYAFFKNMPKGGELHYHLAGGAYPEAMLDVASKGNYCLNKTSYTLTKNQGQCDGIASKDLYNHPELYASIIRNWSMKDFVAGAESGHDHFFASFSKFLQLLSDESPKLLTDVLQRAADQNELYMEIMVLPDDARSSAFGVKISTIEGMGQKRAVLLADQNFQKNIKHTVAESKRTLAETRNLLSCKENPSNKACAIKLNLLYYVLREQTENNFFAQTLNAFEAVAHSEGSLIGVNLVAPESGLISLRDYKKQMRVFEYLHALYPQVKIALHAGELSSSLVNPSELRYHIHDALFTGGAQRIGHGVAIAYEHDAENTLKYMSKNQLAVEINLISNKHILGVSGTSHPLHFYLKNHVPVVLSSDDEGILRTDLTQQYVEASYVQNLDYPTLKLINRNALTYSFAPGKSIWAHPESAELVAECADLQSTQCLEFTKQNEKARLQWALEKELKEFEDKY